MVYAWRGKELTYLQAARFRHRRTKLTKPEDLEAGAMPVDSPFASALELATCDTSPVHSAAPTRACSPEPVLDLEQHPDLRQINSREEDILFFGGAVVLPDASRGASDHGVVRAAAGPNPVMEAMLAVERARAGTTVDHTTDIEMGVFGVAGGGAGGAGVNEGGGNARVEVKNMVRAPFFLWTMFVVVLVTTGAFWVVMAILRWA